MHLSTIQLRVLHVSYTVCLELVKSKKSFTDGVRMLLILANCLFLRKSLTLNLLQAKSFWTLGEVKFGLSQKAKTEA